MNHGGRSSRPCFMVRRQQQQQHQEAAQQQEAARSHFAPKRTTPPIGSPVPGFRAFPARGVRAQFNAQLMAKQFENKINTDPFYHTATEIMNKINAALGPVPGVRAFPPRGVEGRSNSHHQGRGPSDGLEACRQHNINTALGNNTTKLESMIGTALATDKKLLEALPDNMSKLENKINTALLATALPEQQISAVCCETPDTALATNKTMIDSLHDTMAKMTNKLDTFNTTVELEDKITALADRKMIESLHDKLENKIDTVLSKLSMHEDKINAALCDTTNKIEHLYTFFTKLENKISALTDNMATLEQMLANKIDTVTTLVHHVRGDVDMINCHSMPKVHQQLHTLLSAEGWEREDGSDGENSQSQEEAVLALLQEAQAQVEGTQANEKRGSCRSERG